MGCSSAIYAANSNSQAIAANTATVINFGQVIRAYGPNTNISGGNVTINNYGYYVGDTNFSITSAAGTTVTVQIYKDGVLIPGATATQVLGTGTTEIAVSIPFMLRSLCCVESTITAVITATAAANVVNAAILVRKV